LATLLLPYTYSNLPEVQANEIGDRVYVPTPKLW